MFKTRLISGIVLVILAILFIRTGGIVLFLTCLALSIIAANEFYKATNVVSSKTFGLLDIVGYVSIATYYISILFLPKEFALFVIVASFMAMLFVYVLTFPKYKANQIMAAFFAVIYTGVMISCIYLTRALPDGGFHVWLIFISAWGCDTCAYCVGMLIGKRKMAPILSPKKSVEGAIGGLAGATVLGIIFAVITGGPVFSYAVICAAGGVISMVGDLAASAIKRNMNIKDYGKLIPGHGGILDRFDSIIFTAPIIYALSYIIIR